MSSIKLVIDVGVQFIPVVGKILDIGLGKSAHLLSVLLRLTRHTNTNSISQIWLQQPHRWLRICIPKKKTPRAHSHGG